MTTVVTGASGHIGGNLVRALIAEGRQVRCLVRTQARALAGLDVEVVRGDVRDPQSLAAIFKGAQFVYHLAAKISTQSVLGGALAATNVLGAGLAAETALRCGVQRFIHVSSTHAFDLNFSGGRVTEASLRAYAKNCPAYDRSKAAGEREVRRVAQQGLNVVVVHPTAVLGPHDYKPSRMGTVLLGLGAGRYSSVLPGGFDWVDVRDVAQGLIAAEKQGRANESYLLSGHWLSVVELAQAAAAVTGVTPPTRILPMWLAEFVTPIVQSWYTVTGREAPFTTDVLAALQRGPHVETGKAQGELNFHPRPIEETLRDTYQWYVDQGLLVAPSLQKSSGSSLGAS